MILPPGLAEDWQVALAREQRRVADLRRYPAGALINEVTHLMDHPPLTPSQIARILDAVGVAHALIGAHAIAIYTLMPRFTHDVDLIVDDVAKAQQALLAELPFLTAESLGITVGTTLVDSEGRDVIDLLAARHLGRGLALRDVRPVALAEGVVQIPSVETLIALKYIAIRSVNPDGTPGRSAMKQRRDIADLGDLFETQPAFDRQRVEDFLASACSADLAERWRMELPDALAGRGFPPR